MINEGGGEKRVKKGKCEKKCLNSDCGGVTPQMGWTSVFSGRNKTSPLTIRGRSSIARSRERKNKQVS